MTFLSTPPSRVATAVEDKLVTAIVVSIHATLAGGDGSLYEIYCADMEFLSTPPSRVATDGCCALSASTERFYPRHPRGWRQYTRALPALEECFYPRHPRGWRRQTVHKTKRGL